MKQTVPTPAGGIGSGEGGALRHYLGASGLGSSMSSKVVGSYDPAGSYAPGPMLSGPSPGGPVHKNPYGGGPGPVKPPGKARAEDAWGELKAFWLGSRGLGTAAMAGALHAFAYDGGIGSSLTFAALSTLAVSLADVIAVQTGIAVEADHYLHNALLEQAGLGAAAFLPLGMYLGVRDGALVTQALMVGASAAVGPKIVSAVAGEL